MSAEGHFIFALASTILAKKMALLPALEQGDWWHIIAGAMLTCLLPDIDHPKSVLGQRLFWLSVPIAHTFGHRGFTHSCLAIIISIIFITLYFPKDIIPLDAFHAMIIGYLSHIVADMLTPFGVPLLWPFRWRFCFPILQAEKGKNPERLLCITVLIFSLMYSKNTVIFRYFLLPDTMLFLWKQVYMSLLSPFDFKK